MSPRRILSLGQCAADEWTLARLLGGELSAEVVSASTFADAESRLRQGDIVLVLVNRILDRDGASGLDFIARIKADPALRHVPVMLVSNHADAQQQAVALGAVAGFGKAALGDPITVARLRDALASN
jgi:two-component system chemotaxis response regulator CheY